MGKKLTQEEFIERCKSFHGDNYCYDETIYTRSDEKVKVKCHIHGYFFQESLAHMRGRGCNLCRIDSYGGLKEFIEKSNLIHKNFYDYSSVEYKNARTKVKIGCPDHGYFMQCPDSHTSGSRCMKCAKEDIAKIFKHTTEAFIKKASIIHDNFYYYNLVEYKNIDTKVCIICPKHGEFFQTPYKHYNGRGCIRCSHIISDMENEWLNFIKIPMQFRQHKIKLDTKKIKVDGYDPETNTIYEFLGDYYHGNSKIYDKNDINKRVKKTFGELRKETFTRFRKLRKLGYKVIYIWESNWILKTTGKKTRVRK